MDRFDFVWNTAVSFTKLTLSFTQKDSESQYPLDPSSPPKKQVMEWIQQVGWEKISCMDESLFMLEKERIEWSVERTETGNHWMDLLVALSFLYEKSVERGEPTNLIWDHMLSLCLSAWESSEESNSIKGLAGMSDTELEGTESRHIKEVIRSLQRIRKAEMDPEADTKIGEEEENTTENSEDVLDDDVLLGLQSKMKEMLHTIQDPNSGIGKLMGEIMEELKAESIDLDPKTMMDTMGMAMQGMMGGGGGDGIKDGPLGKIMAIVERKVKEKIDGGGMDELKDILNSTKDIFGKDPEEMKGTLMKVLKGMIQKMGLPSQIQGMMFSKMNKIIESMTESFMNQDGPSPDPAQMQEMLAKSMDSVMMDFARQQGQNVSGRKAQRRAARMQQQAPRRDPRLDRLEKLKERLRKKQKESR